MTELTGKEAKLAQQGLGVRRGWRERLLGNSRRWLRSTFGDAVAARVHGARFAYLILRKKKFEQDRFLSLAGELLSRGDVAIDVGANGGDWTYVLSRAVGNTGHVFAFEASPYYAAATEAGLRVLRCANLSLFHFGLSDIRREAHILERNLAGEELSGTGFIVEADEAQGRSARTQLYRLDDLVAHDTRINAVRLLKCDVEGHELQVFNGARSVLAEARPYVVCEVGTAYLSGHADEEVFRFFAEMSYTPYGFVAHDLLKRSASAEDMAPDYQRDRIMVPDERTREFGSLVSARIV